MIITDRIIGTLQLFADVNPKLELNLWDFGSEPDDCFLGLTLAVKPSISALGNFSACFSLNHGVYSDIYFAVFLDISVDTYGKQHLNIEQTF